MFVVDSIVVEDPTYIQTGGMYTTCIDSMNINDKYEFGFNGQLKINEIAGMGNHNTALYWEYDTRLGRRWNLDPKPVDGISYYAAFGNNPITNTDVFGDVISAMNKTSALKGVGVVRKTFGEYAKDVADLFKIGKDGLTFEKVNLGDFKRAYNSIGGSAAQQKSLRELALALYLGVNSTHQMYYGYVRANEGIYSENKNVDDRTLDGFLGRYPQGARDIQTRDGGGATSYSVGSLLKQSLSLMVDESDRNLPGMKANPMLDHTGGRKYANDAELFFHEVLGHGFSTLTALSVGFNDQIQRQFISNYCSINMTNLYYRAMNMPGIRTGSKSHKIFKGLNVETSLGLDAAALGRSLFSK
jgi:hypothetical protein